MAYLASLAVGLGVGVLYALLGVRSPAPPIVALAVRLGMVVGERGVPWVKRRWVERDVIKRAELLVATVRDRTWPGHDWRDLE